MPNKYAAGCDCCVGECVDCAYNISNVVLTFGEEVISWPLGMSLSELPGCSALLRHCTEPVIYDLLTFSAVTAWDGRTGSCWKPFADLGSYEADPNWIGTASCCDPPAAPPAGGGPMAMNGPTPTTPESCIVCGSHYQEGDYACQPTEYYIATFKVHDVTATVKLKVWEEYVVYFRFTKTNYSPAPIQANIRVSRSLYADIQHKLELTVTGYYNDNCPRDETCTIAAADCDEAVTGIAPDQIFGNYWCETGTIGDSGLKDTRYFNCALDTPNWVEITTSTYCFDSGMLADGTWQAGCDSMITACSGTIRDIGGRLGVIVDSDADWETARTGNSTCWIINATNRAWEVANTFGDWIAYALKLRDISGSPFFLPGMPFDRLMNGTIFDRTCDIRDPKIVDSNSCVDGCREYLLGRASYRLDGSGAGVYNPFTDPQFYEDIFTCDKICNTPYWIIEVDGEATVADVFNNVPDVEFSFSNCPVAECTSGNPTATPPDACDYWHEDCCAGTTPATVTVPVGFTVAPDVYLSFLCGP